MNEYRRYMDRQEVSADLHDQLLRLKASAEPKRKRMRKAYVKAVVPAACAALVIGFGIWGLAGSGGVGNSPGGTGGGDRQLVSATDSADSTQLPSQSEGIDQSIPGSLNQEVSTSPANADRAAFLAQGPEGESKLMFPAIFAVNYTDLSDRPQVDAARLKEPDGSFANPLSKEEITRIFWGENGKPAVTNPKTDTGDFPLFLMKWADYLIYGDAYYDGEGNLWRLMICGTKGQDSFEMEVWPGQIPQDCGLYPDLEATEVLGTEVTGWSRSYDCNGDGETEYIVGSRLMTGDYGVRFENIGSGGTLVDNDPMKGAWEFNAMTVNHLVRSDGGLYLDHLLHTDNILAWREKTMETLEEALAEKEFSGYLPTSAPAGYGEFRGHLRYQEGNRRELMVGWSRGYDDVEVMVQLPEGIRTFKYESPRLSYPVCDGTICLRHTAKYEDSLVDVQIPASYDWRLYDGPICDTVPEEYRYHFSDVTFRAEEMSLELVKARMHPHDTGGEICDFNVLHRNGAVVSYHCAGVSAEYVWSLIEGTITE